MSVLNRKVLVALVLPCILAVGAWISGCVGVAEPLPPLAVTPTSLSVNATVGSTTSQVVTVSNIGTASININQTTVTGSGFSATGPTLPLTLSPGQAANLTVKFAATTTGAVDGVLTIVTDPKHRPVLLPLHGKGAAAGSPVTSVAVLPPSASALPDAKVQFTAKIQGTTSNDLVIWTASIGSITSSGLYTAPSTAGAGIVTATSAADATKSASVPVTVTSPSNPNPSPSGPAVTSVAISPVSSSLVEGGVLQFTAAVQGSATDKSVTWKASSGSITSSGAYTAPATIGTATVTATSNADATKLALATVTVTAAPPQGPAVTSVTISPASASSLTSGTLPFTAAVQGTTSNKSVTWKASLGTVTAAGHYTAPAKAGTDTVTATSAADPSKSASASVAVTAAPPPPPPNPVVTSVTVSPASTSASTGATAQFTASVQGTASDKSVNWKASLGSINSSGLYTAPAKAGTDTVTATSSADASKSGTATVSVTSPSPSPSNAISLLKFGNAGFGGDDTSVFQTALNSTASSHQVLEIPAGSYNISPINFPSNSSVQVDAGVTVSANSGFGSGARMLNINSSNVTITGAGATKSVFQMPKARAASQGDGSEYRHCLAIQGASNVTVTGIACNQSGGDGVYVSAATTVTISNCIFDDNFRDGGSVIGQLNHINITNNVFSNTNGTLPQAGVDIEPNNPGDYLLDVNFTDNTMSNNAGDGLGISLWTLDSTSQPVGLTVTRNHSDHNGRYGYFANNNDPSNAPGTITLNDCTTDQSGSDGANARFYDANGASLTFNNLTVTNPHRNGPDPSYGDSAAVAIIRGGGSSVPEGNVHYRNVNVSATNGKVSYYFDFHDGSGVGVSNVTFLPGTLSGATQAPPNGLLSGQTMNSVGQ
jgi:Right handed beta helix region/Abnormal spindle-like microcephaly-assoc'd, ASPM-SPD-2-Hydin/Bacterial Ig-like domain (group 2)